MRSIRLLAVAAAALVVPAVLAPGAAGAAPGFSTQAKVVHRTPATTPVLVGLRVGRHASFDRVVFQFTGPLPGYSVRYVPVVRLDGSGQALPLRGSADLEVVLTAHAHDDAGRSTLPVRRLRPDFPALREANAAGDFEGQVTAGVGAASKVGFRVLELTGPSRIVVDLAHPARSGPGSGTDTTIGPRSLLVTPSSGPVGTRVTVEGRGCANPGQASTRLVFQSGSGGTVGAVDLGEIPNDAGGRFRTTVTVPARMDPLQGVGGGPTRPGGYGFTTRPPVCAAAFTVTGAAAGPSASPGSTGTETGPSGSLPFTGAQTPLLLVAGGGLLLAGMGLLVLRRRPRPASGTRRP
jgi:LPXTG-motif cell wall-anchored protein